MVSRRSEEPVEFGGIEHTQSDRGMTYDQLVDVMNKVVAQPYNEGWGKKVEVSVWGHNMHPVTGAAQTYHRRPRAYVQGRGGGLPYNTNDWVHFRNRYGMSGVGGKKREAELFVGVRAETVRAMMEAAHRQWASVYLTEMYHRLFTWSFGPGGSWERVYSQQNLFHLLGRFIEDSDGYNPNRIFH